MGELSSELKIPVSTATRLADWLVQSDIIERFSDPDDRRIVRVRLTEAGHRVYRIYADFNQKRIEKIFTFSDEEKSQLGVKQVGAN
jgi:DNA-binding MarR family transcriptional regulator